MPFSCHLSSLYNTEVGDNGPHQFQRTSLAAQGFLSSTPKADNETRTDSDVSRGPHYSLTTMILGWEDVGDRSSSQWHALFLLVVSDAFIPQPDQCK